MTGPVIGYVKNLDDCIKALNNIRAYFNEPVASVKTTTDVNDSKDRRYVTDAQLAALNTLIAAAKTAKAATTTPALAPITLTGDLFDVGGTGISGRIQIRFMGLNTDGSNKWQLEVV